MDRTDTRSATPTDADADGADAPTVASRPGTDVESSVAEPQPGPAQPAPEPQTPTVDTPATDFPPGTAPAWTRPALALLLLVTGLLYLWGLGASGWANSYYAAAAQAGSQDWTAFFYGSSDAANSITVDKTPASLWLMALSVRLFGLNSWALLVPQALCGVATVGLLYATVRRWYGPVAGLIAGLVLAVTPVATLMFRFNNPDALLVLLLVAAVYATVRALETASTRWLVFAGALIGFGFLTKMLQAFLLVPVLGAVYLVAAPTTPGRRIRQVLLAGLGVVAAAGWWVAVVELVPAADRPYVGGSQTNSVLELTLGYNGLGRITGNEVGSVGGGGGPGGGGPFSGQTGLLRMFGSQVGGQISWLLPAALILLVVGLVLAGRAARTDRVRAGLLLWGGWLLVTGGIFSYMSGIFHEYYTVALAPAVGALVGIGTTLLWRARTAATRWRRLTGTLTLAVTIAVTAGWSATLLDRTPDWYPWLRTAVLVGGLVAVSALLLAHRVARRVGVPAIAVSVVVALAGPAAYAMQTAATPHTGSIPTAGPEVRGGSGPGGGGRFGGGTNGGRLGGSAGTDDGNGPATPGDDRAGARQPGATDDGQAPGQPPANQAGGGQPGGQRPGDADGGQPGAAASAGRDGGARGGGTGGLLDSREPSAELRELLERDSDSYTWIAATVGANNASGYQLATGKPVMAVGGFNGSDPSPTLEQFQRYVADGQIHWFLGGGGFRGTNGGSSASSEIAAWVAENFPTQTVDGVTLYDLSSGKEG
ncbi:glycosyltransferase family 39 protein [Micromonospora sp. HNM0581]|uniref:ArnT family glycosyltransferase n=1 Tax=Micromonospora sp. HNM0581 TaxID=2716341 RepID=UPI00146B3E21|nr:glycosyltransferase family 39 protein [Micromonospora sp. HNM0581]NLU79681.1 glycosyltransferase family 39 protein [Micromonospora sp. HNM0581]